MSRTPLVEKPPVFGHVDIDDLVDVGDRYINDFDNLKRYYHPEAAVTSKHHPALLAIANSLFSYATDTLNIIPNRVAFDFDTRPVYPGQSQRDIEWHVDDPNNERHVKAVVLASSALPTEFLVPGPNYAEFMSEQNDHPVVTARRFAIVPYANARIEEGVLDIYSPEPGEIIMMTNHIHRSPYNRTDEDIQRVWMRGWLEEMRGVDC